jgi:hypothetical protein
LFRRSKAAEPAPPAPVKEGGKGRPTPTRAEAQAAARARAKGAMNKKEAARLQRQRRSETNAKVRQGMRAGDERFLPARDKGPVRRYVRDFIDARLCIAEMLLPLLVIIMIAQSVAPNLSGSLSSTMILLVLLDTSLMIFRLKRELRRRFPEEDTKGAVGYAVLRSLQLRWLRIPKAKVKLGAKLPERY